MRKRFKTQHREALDGLKVARALAIWFHQALALAMDKEAKQGAALHETALQQHAAKQKTHAASQYIALNEALARILIDQLLKEAVR